MSFSLTIALIHLAMMSFTFNQLFNIICQHRDVVIFDSRWFVWISIPSEVRSYTTRKVTKVIFFTSTTMLFCYWHIYIVHALEAIRHTNNFWRNVRFDVSSKTRIRETHGEISSVVDWNHPFPHNEVSGLAHPTWYICGCPIFYRSVLPEEIFFPSQKVEHFCQMGIQKWPTEAV